MDKISLTPKDDPKDRIQVEVGDFKQKDFYPQVKIMRWDNEVNFSVRLKDTDYTGAKIAKVGDKLTWSKDNIDIEYYPYTEDEGGMKMVWYLKSKPATNKVEFSLQSKGLNFYYQPELTQEEIDNGHTRPENVVGSYAIYHQTKGGLNDVNGKNYKTGQAFFIYKSQIIDAEGKQTWAILNIDTENGIFSEEIPQEFLDKAIYPIKGNATIGLTTEGGSGWSVTGINDRIFGSWDTADASGGDVSEFACWVKLYNADIGVLSKMAIYNYTADNNAGTLVGNSNEISISSTGLKTLTPSGTISLSASTKYFVVFWGESTVGSGGMQIAYNSVSTKGVYVNVTYGGAFPSPLTGETGGNYQFSIYATYTPSGGGTNMKVNVGDTHKEISAAQINISDTWKPITKAQVNVGDTWKSVF